jgi:ABC-type dipeptide/oligopeptide/nickel transport system permease subunit
MYKKFLPIVLFVLPVFAFAQTGTVDDVLMNFMNLLLAVSKLMAPLAMLFFFYQLIQFIKASKEGATTLEKNKDMLIYSGIILFVMVGIWSIVGYIQQSIGPTVTNSDIRETPPIPRDLPM